MADRHGAPRLGRGMAILAVVLLGAMVVTPAFSAFQPTKGKIKKLAAKQVQKLAPTLTVGAANQLTSQTKLSFQAAAGTGGAPLFEGGGLKLEVECDTGPAVEVFADTTVDHASFQSYGNGSDINDDDFTIGEQHIISEEDEERDAVYTTPGGGIVLLQYAVAEGTLYGGAAGCFVKGVAQVL